MKKQSQNENLFELVFTDSIEDLLLEQPDLSPVLLSEFNYPDYKLLFKMPISLLPVLDESQQIICLENQFLGIDIGAFTRDELEESLSAEIDVLWRNYAMSEDDLLTPEAQQLKRNLLSTIEAEYAER